MLYRIYFEQYDDERMTNEWFESKSIYVDKTLEEVQAHVDAKNKEIIDEVLARYEFQRDKALQEIKTYENQIALMTSPDLSTFVTSLQLKVNRAGNDIMVIDRRVASIKDDPYENLEVQDRWAFEAITLTEI